MISHKNILLLFPTIIKGGAEKVVLTNFNLLAENTATDIYVLSLTGLFDLNTKLSQKIKKIEGRFRPKKNIIANLIQDYFTVPLFLYKIIKKHNINTIVSGYEYEAEQYFIPVLLIRQLYKIKTVSFILTDIRLKHRDVSRRRRMTYWLIDRLRENLFDVIILCTKSIFKGIQTKDTSKYFVIPNTIDIKNISIKSVLDISDDLGDLKLPKSYVISVSRFSRQKNLILTLASFKLVKNIVDFDLIIIGNKCDVREYNNIVDYIIKNELEDRVLLIEALSNPYPLIKNASALILTSTYEGLPLAILEAMCLETPVISTKYYCHEDLLNSKNSIIVPDFTQNSLAKVLLKFHNNEYEINKIVANAYELVQTYDANESFEKLRQILELN